MKPSDIKHLRVCMGISQTDFGELLGVSLRTVQNYEKGDSTPPGGVLMKLIEMDAKIGVQNGSENTKKVTHVLPANYKAINDKVKEIELRYAPDEIILHLSRNWERYIYIEDFKELVMQMAEKINYTPQILQEIQELKDMLNLLKEGRL